MMSTRRFSATLGVIVMGVCLVGCDPVGTAEEDEKKDPHFLKGDDRKRAMDYKGAIESYERALDNNPRSASAHLELALLYERQEKDPVTAIYHYNRYLKLKADPPHRDVVLQYISACKMELAAANSYTGGDSARMNSELARVAEENVRLKREVEQLRQELALRPTNYVIGTPTPPPTQGQHSAPAPVAPSPPASQPKSAARTHKVKSGETLTSIAKQHRVSLASLQAANPGVVPKDLKPGQELKLPASR